VSVIPATSGGTAPDPRAITEALAEAAVAAGNAPSIHNTQPWRWRLDNDTLELLVERSRLLGVTDPDRRLFWTWLGSEFGVGPGAIDPGAIQPQRIAFGRCNCHRSAIDVAAKVGPQQADFAGNGRPSQGQVAPRCDTIAVQDNFTGPLDPGADRVDIATNASSRKVDATLHIGAAQQDASSSFQPFGIDSDPAGHRDRRAIRLDIAANATPAKPDLSGYGRAADRECATRFQPVALQTGQSRPVEEQIVDNGRA